MNEIYWLTRVVVFGNLCGIIAIIGLVFLFVICFFFPFIWDMAKETDCTKQLIKSAKIASVVWLVGILGWLFIPSKNDLLLMYGVGSTIDHIKSNEKTKELPDKVIDALTRYVDNMEKEQEK